MESLSLPYRIALLVILAFGAIYLVVLKPGGGDEQEAFTAPPVAAQSAPAETPSNSGSSASGAPGVDGLSTAVGKAKGAAATSTAANAAAQSANAETPAVTSAKPAATTAQPAATADPAVPAPGAAATASEGKEVEPIAAKQPAAAAAAVDPSGRILGELAKGHTAVVLFTTRTAADDRAVRRAVTRIDRRGGRVDLHVVPLARVGRYEAITRGVTIKQSPTVLVIGRDRRARTIVGFTTTAEVDQLVADVRAGR